MTLTHSRALSLAAAVLALGLVPSLAAAQTIGTTYVTTTSSPSTNTYAPGTNNAVLGTISFSASQPGTYQIASVPLTLTATGGGTASNLSACQLVNANGTALNTNANALNSVSAGNNTLTFDTPLMVAYGTPTTLTVRCNTSSATPFGSTFAFAAGSPTFTPSLTATLTVFPTIVPGAVNAPVAAITLNPSTSGTNLNITSIPLTATFNGGLNSSNLSNCRIMSSGSTLNVNSTGMINAGANSFVLDTPFAMTGGTGAMALVLSCTVSTAAPIGGSVNLALAPSGILAANAVNGSAVTAMQGSDPATGALGSLGGTTTVVAPGTTVITTPVVTVPNTGAGAGSPIAIALLIASALIAIGGMGYLARTLRTA